MNTLSARRAKQEFQQKVEADPRVVSMTKSRSSRARDAWVVETDCGTKVVWLKYSRFAGDPAKSQSPFYGSTWTAVENLRNEHSLYFVFLGVTTDHCWTVPFADFVSRLSTSEKKNGEEWRLKFDQGDNRRILEEYDCIDPLFDL